MQIELFSTTPPPKEVIELLARQPLNNLPKQPQAGSSQPTTSTKKP